MNLNELYEQYAEQIGKDELTDAEKQQAVLNAVLEGKKIEPIVWFIVDTQEGKVNLVRILKETIRRMGEQEEDTL